MVKSRTMFLVMVLLAACTWPVESQTVDTTGWRYTDSVPTAWRYTDSVPVLDTVVPPPVSIHPGEPAGFNRLIEHDFVVPIIKDQPYRMQGQAGCWYAHSGGAFVNGKYLVTFPVGLGEGRTPNKLEAYSTCPPATKAVNQFYFHLIGYFPGDGTPFWNNGEGDKAVFVRYNSGAPLIFKCDSPYRPSGVKSTCNWSLYTNAGNRLASTGRGVVTAGKPNDIACLLQSGSTVCWVNGAVMSWSTPATGMATGVWLDWTYGGGGGGTPVGVLTRISLDGFYASGK